MKFTGMAVALLLVGCVGAGLAAEPAPAEPAKLPYLVLYHLAHPVQLKGPFAGVAQWLTVTSSRPGIKAADIDMAVASRDGRVPIKLQENGTFTLPERPEWLQENPKIITNQPKGSMQLSVQRRGDFTFAGKPYPYAELVSPLVWAREMAREMEAGTGLRTNPLYTTVSFKLPTAEDVILIERQGAEPQVLKPDDKGVCRLVWDAALLRQNPTVRLPTGDITYLGVTAAP